MVKNVLITFSPRFPLFSNELAISLFSVWDGMEVGRTGWK